MPSAHDTLFRHWNMLRQVPRYPAKASVQSIRHTLRSSGFDISERTVQRDLQDLSSIFPLQCDDREKPFGWSWQKDAPSFDLPSLSIPEALMLALAQRFLSNLLPAPMHHYFDRLFSAAQQRLEASPKTSSGRSWVSKVLSIAPAQPLLSPRVSNEIQNQISEALMMEQQIELTYKRRGEEKSTKYRVHPLALIQRGPMLYLCCRFSDYTDLRTIALNRVQEVVMLDEQTTYPDGFSVEMAAKAGLFDVGTGNQIVFCGNFELVAGAHLYETPLSADQEITQMPDGRLRVVATVSETEQLKWWLLGMGEGVEVVSPSKLRDAIRETIEKMSQVYSEQ